MHLQPVFENYQVYGGEVSARLFDRGLCLPSGSSLDEEDRARVIAGPPALCAKVAEAIRHSLCRRRDPAKLLAEVAQMRLRIDKEHKTKHLWRVKHRRGGIVDLEFIAQYLQLRHAAEQPEVLSTNSVQALQNLAAAGCLDAGDARILIEAAQFWAGLQAMLRLTWGEDFDDGSASQGLRAVRLRAGRRRNGGNAWPVQGRRF